MWDKFVNHINYSHPLVQFCAMVTIASFVVGVIVAVILATFWLFDNFGLIVVATAMVTGPALVTLYSFIKAQRM